MKKGYYNGVNWGVALLDVSIIFAVVYLENYWLLILLLFTGDSQLLKEVKNE